jgi:hypothetical protein
MRRSRSGLILGLLALLLIGAGVGLLGANEVADPGTDIAYGDGETSVESGDLLETEQLEGHAHLTGSGPKVAKPVNHMPPGPVVVTVKGPLGHVIPHLDIVVGPTLRVLTKEQAAEQGVDPDAEPKTSEATTDEEGKAYFDELPRDGSVFVRPKAKGPTAQWGANAQITRFVLLSITGKNGRSIVTPHLAGSGTPVIGESVSLDLPTGIPARVTAVDATDGAPVDATLVASPGLDAKGPLAGPVRGSTYFAAKPGREHILHPVQGTDDHYVATKRGSFRAAFSPAAKLFEAQVPLRRSTEISVTLPPDVDTQDVDKWTLSWNTAGARGKASARLDSYSRLLATGVPYTPGAHVSITAVLPDQGHVWASGRFDFDDSVLVLEGHFKPARKAKGKTRTGSVNVSRAQKMRELAKQLEKTEEATRRLEIDLVGQQQAAVVAGTLRSPDGKPVTIHLSGVNLEGRSTPGGSIFVSGKEGGWVTSGGGDDNLGNVRVEVTTPALERARGALVYVGGRSGRADDRGVALFKNMKPGSYPVRVFGAGAPATDKVTVVAKRTATVSLSAPTGGRVEVTFEDEHGRPLPFASLTIKQPSGLPYADVDEDGVQRLDLFADAAGRRTLHSMEPGKVEVVGRYAGQSASYSIDVTDEESTALAITIHLDKKGQSPKQQLKELAKEAKQIELEARRVELDAAKVAIDRLMRDLAEKAEKADR